MTRNELNKFIQQSISEQGNASSMALTQLVIELMKHVPCVVHVASNETKGLKFTGNSVKPTPDDVIFNVVDSQDEINAIIDAIAGSEVSSVCAYYSDAGLTIHFPIISGAINDEVICYLTGYAGSFGGTFTLLLSKEEGRSKLSFVEKI